MARQALFIRLDSELHRAVEAAAAVEKSSAAGWARAKLAQAVGSTALPRRSPRRRKAKPVEPDQRDLRAIVAALGGLGAAVREAGLSPELLAEIQAAVAVVVDRIARP